MGSASQQMFRSLAGCCAIIGIGAAIVLHTDDVLDFLGLPKKSDAAEQSDAPVMRAQSAQLAKKGDRTVVLRSDGSGHFNTTVRMNGRPVDVMVDTGATVVALSDEDANAIGIFPRAADYTGRTSTANGIAKVAPVMIDEISIDDITVRNVRGVVMERGAMRGTLLGMSFMSRLSRAEMSRGTLTLEQ